MYRILTNGDLSIYFHLSYLCLCYIGQFCGSQKDVGSRIDTGLLYPPNSTVLGTETKESLYSSITLHGDGVPRTPLNPRGTRRRSSVDTGESEVKDRLFCRSKGNRVKARRCIGLYFYYMELSVVWFSLIPTYLLDLPKIVRQ